MGGRARARRGRGRAPALHAARPQRAAGAGADRLRVGAPRAASHRRDAAAAVGRVPRRSGRRGAMAARRTSTASFAICTPTSARRSKCRCARCTAPARRRSSTTRARSRSIVDPATGEVIEVELFVMVLGASNYTYAEATRTQRTADFVGSTVRALEYFGGVPLDPRARSAAQRRERAGPLRPGDQPDVRGDGAALRRGDRAGATEEAARTRRRSRPAC